MPRRSALAGEQRCDRQGGTVQPEPLEAVVETLLTVEHVHHEAPEVEQDPPPCGMSFAVQGLRPGRLPSGTSVTPTLYSQAAVVPIAMSVSMLAVR